MYSVSLTTNIDIPPDQLLKIWRRPKILLKEAKNIKKLDIVKRQKNKVLTDWEVEIDDVVLKWRQWDKLDAKKGTISFMLDKGDFAKYFGCWQIMPHGKNKTHLRVDVSIDWGIPKFEPHARRKLQKVTARVFKEFTLAIKDAVQKS